MVDRNVWKLKLEHKSSRVVKKQPLTRGEARLGMWGLVKKGILVYNLNNLIKGLPRIVKLSNCRHRHRSGLS